MGDGSLWIRAESAMPLLYEHLRDDFSRAQDWADQTLACAMQGYLKALKEQDLLDDDATLGLLVTARAVGHQLEFCSLDDSGASTWP